MTQSGLGDVEPTQTDGRTAAVFSYTCSSQRKRGSRQQHNIQHCFKQ